MFVLIEKSRLKVEGEVKGDSGGMQIEGDSKARKGLCISRKSAT